MRLPLSKSVETRRMVLDFLAGGCKGAAVSPADGADCEDITVASTILAAGIPADGATVDVKASGTALRIFTALAAAIPGCRCTISGSGRLNERPIAPLVDALRSMGADIRYCAGEGHAPLEIAGKRLAGGCVELDASLSSQFATALMLAAPLMDRPLEIKYKVLTVSGPYVQLTASMLRQRGVEAEADAEGVKVKNTMPAHTETAVLSECDWSAASFWYEIAAVSAGWVTLPGLSSCSLQPDRRAVELFEKLGAVTDFTDEGAELSATPDLINTLEADLSETPDLVPPLVVTACLVGIPFRLHGVAGLRHKECDRLEALIEEMKRIGCLLTTADYGNTLVWETQRVPLSVIPVFDSHNDHRIAMALAAASLFLPGIGIEGAESVSKSYPGFWDDLRGAGFTVVDAREVTANDGEQTN